MSNIKCGRCGLYSFARSTECRRCMQPLSTQPVIQTPTYAANLSVAGNSSPYAATPIQTESVFPPSGSWTPVTNPVVNSDVNTQHHAPAFMLAFFFLATMVITAGFPPKLENMPLSLCIFHISIFSLIILGLGKWLFSESQIGAAKQYSGEIEGFLMLPAASMIAYSLLTFWMAIECWFISGKLAEQRGSTGESSLSVILTGGHRRMSNVDEIRNFTEFLSLCFLLISILFVVALVFFYRKHKRAPLICISALLLNIVAFIFISFRGQQLEKKLSSSIARQSSDSVNLLVDDLLLIAGGLCVLFNFIAFILYFVISRRVKATFV
jgi:hypothetical protein